MPKRKEEERKLPPGVKLRHTLRGHTKWIGRIAWSPDGRMIASPSRDKTIRIWDAETGRLIRTLQGHSGSVYCAAWSPDGLWLASASDDKAINIWESRSGSLVQELEGHTSGVPAVAWSPDGEWLASGGMDSTIQVWKPGSGRQVEVQKSAGTVTSIVWSPDGQMLACSTLIENSITLWDVANRRFLRTLGKYGNSVWSVAWSPKISDHPLAAVGSDPVVRLLAISEDSTEINLEGQTGRGICNSFSPDGELFALKEDMSNASSIRLWRCDSWEPIAVIPEPTSNHWSPGLAFHPSLSLLATVGSDLNAKRKERDTLIHIWELDLAVLLNREPAAKARTQAVHHTTAKIVVVGDSGVGKTGLGWKLAHGEYKEHSSTHGQQFWVLNSLSTRRDDNTECEAILWDLAGQPDYRLTHALFLDDADLALILFDPTDSRDPVHGVEFWLKQLKSGQQLKSKDEQCACPTVLVGARADRGEARLTQEELDEFCRQRGIMYVTWNIKTFWGVPEFRQSCCYELSNLKGIELLSRTRGLLWALSLGKNIRESRATPSPGSSYRLRMLSSTH